MQLSSSLPSVVYLTSETAGCLIHWTGLLSWFLPLKIIFISCKLDSPTSSCKLQYTSLWKHGILLPNNGFQWVGPTTSGEQLCDWVVASSKCFDGSFCLYLSLITNFREWCNTFCLLYIAELLSPVALHKWILHIPSQNCHWTGLYWQFDHAHWRQAYFTTVWSDNCDMNTSWQFTRLQMSPVVVRAFTRLVLSSVQHLRQVSLITGHE